MSKHDEQFKLKVVLDYLSERVGSFKTVGQAHGVNEATVRKWVANYREHGSLGLHRKGTSYLLALLLRAAGHQLRCCVGGEAIIERKTGWTSARGGFSSP